MINIISEGEGGSSIKILFLKWAWFQNAVFCQKGTGTNLKELPVPKLEQLDQQNQ